LPGHHGAAGSIIGGGAAPACTTPTRLSWTLTSRVLTRLGRTAHLVNRFDRFDWISIFKCFNGHQYPTS
jgi:hypothetical protein